ncbi:AsmA-like C-terminal region-containing protein [Aliiruegeria sabulilitoris]|uniref:AsmA-like C-terminal region-containing protein n=1 Tax=Aliiruegeria sabulilitoris TaxID=1510458 RepID=UPI00082C063E|nr:AsmA-like C-terminal region-containing protein [Aliiruegeria sabulilitoris]
MAKAKQLIVSLSVLFFAATVILIFALKSDQMRGWRVGILENALTELLKTEVEIDGDVQISFVPGFSIAATKVRLPTQRPSGQDLARLQHVRLSLAPLQGLKGQNFLPEISARDVSINIVQEKTVAGAPNTDERGYTGVVVFFLERSVDLRDVAVRIEEFDTGFEFEISQGQLQVSQDADDAQTTVTSEGVINGGAFEISGSFPETAPFEANGKFGKSKFSLHGEQDPEMPKGSFKGELSAETDDLSDLFAMLRLESNIEGTGKISSKVENAEESFAFEGLDLDLRLTDGKRVQVAGDFANTPSGADMDLQVEADLFPADQVMRPAVFLRDIRPQRVSARVVGEQGVFRLEHLDVETNAFDHDLKSIGPFRIGDIDRTPDDSLQLTDLSLELGPAQAPYLAARADVQNILEMRGFSVTGSLDLPVSWVLRHLDLQEREQFGHLVGSLDLQGSEGEAIELQADVHSANAELWSGSASLSTDDLRSLADFSAKMNLDTADGATFFKALDLKPVNTGQVVVEGKLDRIEGALQSIFSVELGGSKIGANLKSTLVQGAPVITGAVESDKLALVDLRKFVLAFRELEKAAERHSELQKQRHANLGSTEDGEFQPLVLPTEPEEPDAGEDLEGYQPLVIETQNGQARAEMSDQEDLSDFQPLVLASGIGDLPIADIEDPRRLARALDADIGIHVRKLTGQKGISKLNSQLVVKQGKLNFGPLSVKYGGGSAVLSAAMNMVDAPGLLRVSGQTSGWNLGEILQSLNVGVGASGTLRGSFDLRGSASSSRAFLRTMRGKAELRMSNGRISTSLIELTGLGVLPWLFSQEMRRGYADIVCMRAPLRVDRGRIEFNSAVLETRRVQLVGKGVIDVPRDQIAFSAVPRAVGRPLSRSALPFTVQGSLHNPKVNVKFGGSAPRRVPLEMPEKRVPCVPDYRQMVKPPRGR